MVYPIFKRAKMPVEAEQTTPWLKRMANRIPYVAPALMTTAPSVLTVIAVVIICALQRCIREGRCRNDAKIILPCKID